MTDQEDDHNNQRIEDMTKVARNSGLALYNPYRRTWLRIRKTDKYRQLANIT